jgi:hypothetical protein
MRARPDVSEEGAESMLAGGFIWRLLRTLRRSFTRVALWFVVTGLIAAVVVELAAIFNGTIFNGTSDGASGLQTPTGLTHLTALVLGLGVGYAASATIFIFEVIRDLFVTLEEIEQDAMKELRSGESLVDGLVEGVTGTALGGVVNRTLGRR